MEIPLVRHPDSVTIVPVDGEEIFLVSQTRRGAQARLLELPAGTLEPGESPDAAARRELAEECGLEAEEWCRVGGFWVVPSYSTEFLIAAVWKGLSAVASALSAVDSPHRDEDEDIEIERVPAREAFGRVEDAGSLAALALWRTAG